MGQVNTAREYLRKAGKSPVTNIVFMGMGEPMDNIDNVATALDILKDQSGLDLSYRKITLSSVGLVDGLKTLSAKSAVIAISLNAVDDDTRSMLMPINRLYSVGRIMDFVRGFKGTKRTRITFEYILIKGVNDSLDDAKRLADLLKGVKCKINLIPYNPSSYTELRDRRGVRWTGSTSISSSGNSRSSSAIPAGRTSAGHAGSSAWATSEVPRTPLPPTRKRRQLPR